MTVSELIDILKTKNGNMRVIVNGYEGGYCDLTPQQIQEIPIALNANDPPSYCGPHDDPDDDDIAVTALILSRRDYA